MIFFALPIFFILLPAIAWNWRLLLTILIIGVSGLAFIWFRYAPKDANLFDIQSDGWFFGIFYISAFGLAAMIIGRAVGLKLQARGKTRLSVLWVDALTLLGLFAGVAPLII